MLLIQWLFALSWLFLAPNTLAIEVNWNSTDSIKRAASTMAYDMMVYYPGNKTGGVPGLLGEDAPSEPYYWWEAGAMFGSLINYWHFTGDPSYNSVVMEAMQFQVGEHEDYNPRNQSASMGNDDQAFWAISAMQAVEYNFPNPPPGQPSWLGLVQAVFNEQAARWDNSTCNGGLRWQVYRKSGWDLKNTISNGAFFQIAARLARYTGDEMYAEWAVKAWDWMWRIGLIDNENWNIYDNSEATRLNCSELDRHQWTYNPAILLMGAATMYNYTNGSPLWANRTTSLLTRLSFNFFPNSTMRELCEAASVCNVDQRSFKAYMSRWLTSAAQLAPFISAPVQTLLSVSAAAAAAQCTGGASGTLCGITWWEGKWDGSDGVGQQMSALEVTVGALVGRLGGDVKPPLTNSTGGTSLGKPDAGNIDGADVRRLGLPPSRGHRVGAWVFTAVLCATVVVALVFLWSSLGEEEEREVGGGVGKNGKGGKGIGAGCGMVGVGGMVIGMKRMSRGKGKGKQTDLGALVEENTPRYRGGKMVT